MRGSLDLCADTSRQLHHTDPQGRDMVVSCGAVLNHLELAAAMTGWAANISRLPDPDDAELLARVTFDRAAPTQDQVRFATAIEQRHTDRRQVSSWPVPKERLDTLSRLAESYGVRAVFDLNGRQVHVIGESLSEAKGVQDQDSGCVEETVEWMHEHELDGIPEYSRLTDHAAKTATDSVHRFPSGLLADELEEEAPPQPSWLVLSTSSDDALSWLRAGEALSAMWLHCSSAGLSLVPYSQPVEVEETRSRIEREVLSDRSCPQLLVRVGWASSNHGAPPFTSRRPVDSVFAVRAGQE